MALVEELLLILNRVKQELLNARLVKEKDKYLVKT
jgi:hypothetical protein